LADAAAGARRHPYDDITPVDTFRVILDQFFDAELPLLPDQSFFSTWSAPYRFVDVTDRASR